MAGKSLEPSRYNYLHDDNLFVFNLNQIEALLTVTSNFLVEMVISASYLEQGQNVRTAELDKTDGILGQTSCFTQWPSISPQKTYKKGMKAKAFQELQGGWKGQVVVSQQWYSEGFCF